MNNTVIHQEIKFNTDAKKIYEALTDSKQFSELSGGAPAEIHPEAGGSFSLFGGMISGRNIELIPNKRIVQAWRPGNWEEGLYSIVKIEFIEKGSETILMFDHTAFPEEQREHLDAGWHANYWQPLQTYLS
ncbi:SRPBCC domain-containing protein [Metabacillus idriensis]|uniref:SRPBCC domain-containing protein n=1 Tax=Metabacillus idriensis TaxID=324768 RepID=UPI003D2CC3FE